MYEIDVFFNYVNYLNFQDLILIYKLVLINLTLSLFDIKLEY